MNPEATATQSAAARVRDLSTKAGHHWELRATAGPVPANLGIAATTTPAVVPGEVHTDLLRNGLIPDPFDGGNEHDLAWIGLTDWQYRTTFVHTANGHVRHDLVAEGLDTAATIRLNGSTVATTANQHRSYRFDVATLLVEGENELVIDFRAPVEFAREQEELLGARPLVMHHPFNAVRKMACSFGWDWGIDIAGAGIWRPIRLESWSGARIASVRPLATLDDDGTGHLAAHVELEWDGSSTAPATLSATIAGTTLTAVAEPGTEAVRLQASFPAVAPWWPRGYGDATLHDLAVTLDGAAANSWSGRVGFRTVELHQAPDAEGSSFVFRVNGQEVYVRGANWIPDDALVTRVTRASVESSLRNAVDAGMNLLRVWGGGLYESEDFYDVCDELGLLVWQDFLFACAAYSEEDPLRSEVEAEAREAVTRLSRHPSLALWNGCNENIWAYVEWGWQVPLAGRSWGEGYYTDLLPAIVAELDPRVPYSAGSPFSYSNYIHPNDPRHGTTHIWDVWNEKDYSHYASYRPRFASEFGFQGPPAWSTLTSAVHDEPLEPYGEQMLVHQKAHEGNLKLERGLGEHLPVPTDIDDWHWATQLNQARAVAFGIEHFRSLYPINQGAVVWQLNDSWPVVSWAAVDGCGIRKPLWHALHRVYAERLATVQPHEAGLAVVVHNDSATELASTLLVRRLSTGTDAAELASVRVEVRVPAHSAATYPLPADVAEAGNPNGEYLRVGVADVGGTAAPVGLAPAYYYFVEDPRLELADPADVLTVETAETADGVDVTVRAAALVKDIALFPDRLDPAASVDTALVTLSAGESHVFHVTGAGLDARALTSAPVLRSASDLIVKYVVRR